jgi:hypothetical protein
MQFEYGKKTFTRTKFDGLDGKTTVALTNEDDTIAAKATSAGVRFELRAECTERQDVVDLIHAFGNLMDHIWDEHKRLRQGALNKLTEGVHHFNGA